MNIKPVIITSRGACVFVDDAGRMEIAGDRNKSRYRINNLTDRVKK